MMKFNSLFGFATNEAKKGEKVSVLLQANCNDKEFRDGLPVMATRTLDEFVYPEVMHRINAKQLTPNFRLEKAHVIMNIDTSRNEILLNEEVRMRALVDFKDGKVFEPGQPVKEEDIREILALYASDKNDPNAAHIMLLKFRLRWYFAFDLIYNRQKVGNRFVLSKQFLKSAENNMKDKSWGPMVDNLFSATELAVQSIFLLHPFPGFSQRQNHDDTRKYFADYAENGNIDVKYSEHFTKLDELRPKARYLNSISSRGFSLEEAQAQELIDTTREMVSIVGRWLEKVNLASKPRVGHYIAIGQG